MTVVGRSTVQEFSARPTLAAELEITLRPLAADGGGRGAERPPPPGKTAAADARGPARAGFAPPVRATGSRHRFAPPVRAMGRALPRSPAPGDDSTNRAWRPAPATVAPLSTVDNAARRTRPHGPAHPSAHRSDRRPSTICTPPHPGQSTLIDECGIRFRRRSGRGPVGSRYSNGRHVQRRPAASAPAAILRTHFAARHPAKCVRSSRPRLAATRAGASPLPG
jgi:hypothetical protein